jgi:hypothetical protein
LAQQQDYISQLDAKNAEISSLAAKYRNDLENQQQTHSAEIREQQSAWQQKLKQFNEEQIKRDI